MNYLKTLQLLRIIKAVADAAHRFDFAATVSQLFAKTENLYINGAGSDHVIVASDLVDNLLARENPAGPLGKKFQDAAFGGR